jgi:glycine cleavage system H protein
MSEKKFSKKHEWVSVEGDVATVGITKHATEMLGDIVFVEVPETGKAIEQNNQAAVVESTKAASDVYSPISGEVTEGNKLIVDDPSSVNSDPEGASWFFKIKIKDSSELDSLMSKSDYDKFVAENPN